MRLLTAVALGGNAQAVDTGRSAVAFAELAGADLLRTAPGGWIRLRGVDLTQIDVTRVALTNLRARGFRTCVMVRWDHRTWKSGTRSNPRGDLPLDLREAFARGKQLREAFGDLVDAWELDNEPDLGWSTELAENYTAFLKAFYLGFDPQSMIQSTGAGSVPGPERRVLMGSLGLPPGPWYLRFQENHGLSYSDGLNYHYYGYASDFAAVGQSFRLLFDIGAWDSKTDANGQPASTLWPGVTEKELPVFVTEIGYGMLGMRERETKEARLRQWRWFASVGKQLGTFPIDAPMAFYLNRYDEASGLEFGLTVPTTSMRHFDLYERNGRYSGNHVFRPADFGATKEELWMRLIGKQIGSADITPALAWWLSEAAKQKRKSDDVMSKPWVTKVNEKSPVVIDFIAGKGTTGIKRFNAFMLEPADVGYGGEGTLVVYNFSDAEIRGNLTLPDGMTMGAAIPESIDLALAPQERRVLDVQMRSAGESTVARSAGIAFVPAGGSKRSVFQTAFFPNYGNWQRGNVTTITRHYEDDEAQRRLARIQRRHRGSGPPITFVDRGLTRPRDAEESPRTEFSPHWWVQDGAKVEFTDDGFIVTITHAPPGKERRVEVETFIGGFRFRDSDFLGLRYRAIETAPRKKADPPYDEFYVQLRGSQGGLYGVYPMRPLKTEWQEFLEPYENFTLWFYGRADASSALLSMERRIDSLVLVFFPVNFPAKYEFKHAQFLKMFPPGAAAPQQSQPNRLVPVVSPLRDRDRRNAESMAR